MHIQPYIEPQQPEDESGPEQIVLDTLAQRIKDQSKRALIGQDERLREVAAEYAHLGGVADELLALALHDLAVLPDYFGQVARFGFERALGLEKPPQEPERVEGKVVEKGSDEETSDEQQIE